MAAHVFRRWKIAHGTVACKFSFQANCRPVTLAPRPAIFTNIKHGVARTNSGCACVRVRTNAVRYYYYA